MGATDNAKSPATAWRALTIRAATSADAAALAMLAERTFRDAFAAVNTPADMDIHCHRNFSTALQAREISTPTMHTLLAEYERQLIGYAQLRRSTAPQCVRAQRSLEVQRFYVDQRWHGRGAAQALMTRAIEYAAGEGADAIWLGVWERNPRAIAFYGKYGFRPVGNQIFNLGSDPQRDQVMAKMLHANALSEGVDHV